MKLLSSPCNRREKYSENKKKLVHIYGQNWHSVWRQFFPFRIRVCGNISFTLSGFSFSTWSQRLKTHQNLNLTSNVSFPNCRSLFMAGPIKKSKAATARIMARIIWNLMTHSTPARLISKSRIRIPMARIGCPFIFQKEELWVKKLLVVCSLSKPRISDNM